MHTAVGYASHSSHALNPLLLQLVGWMCTACVCWPVFVGVMGGMQCTVVCIANSVSRHTPVALFAVASSSPAACLPGRALPASACTCMYSDGVCGGEASNRRAAQQAHCYGCIAGARLEHPSCLLCWAGASPHVCVCVLVESSSALFCCCFCVLLRAGVCAASAIAGVAASACGAETGSLVQCDSCTQALRGEVVCMFLRAGLWAGVLQLLPHFSGCWLAASAGADTPSNLC